MRTLNSPPTRPADRAGHGETTQFASRPGMSFGQAPSPDPAQPPRSSSSAPSDRRPSDAQFRCASPWPALGWAVAVLLSLIWPRAIRECRATDSTEGAYLIYSSTTNAPYLRLSHLPSGSGTPQVWDVAGDFNTFYLSSFYNGVYRFPFKVNSAAPDNSLYVTSGNAGACVGIGGVPDDTDVNLQVFAYGQPSIRMSQSSAPYYDWDIVTNQSNWLVWDRTADTIPFKIASKAPTNSLFVGTSGNIGMGTAVPQVIVNTAAVGRILNVRSDTNSGRVVVQGQVGGLLELVDLSAGANRKNFRMFSRAGFARFQVVKDDQSAASVNNVMAFDMSNGNVGLKVNSPAYPLHLASGAYCTAGGVWTNASSREFKQDIQPITSAQARDTVRALQPVGFRYKNEPEERYVGFIAEDVPELVATHDRQSLAPMDIVGVLTKVVQDQDRQLDEQRQRNDTLERLVESLMLRVTDLEQRGDGAAPKQ